MNIERKIQENNYFKYRKIDAATYENQTLPSWIKNEITDKNNKILDYGCGFGQILTALKKENYSNVFGVDIEINAIDFCLLNHLNVKKLNLKKLNNPFDFKFNVIILSHIIEHIPKNEIINTLAFIKKNFLTENGKLLIAIPNAQSNTGSYWAYEDWTHSTLFTSGSIYYVLKAAGFNHIEFIDIDCSSGKSAIKKVIRKLLLKIYTINNNFWNEVTCSSYHKASPQIFSYEIKVTAY